MARHAPVPEEMDVMFRLVTNMIFLSKRDKLMFFVTAVLIISWLSKLVLWLIFGSLNDWFYAECFMLIFIMNVTSKWRKRVDA